MATRWWATWHPMRSKTSPCHWRSKATLRALQRSTSTVGSGGTCGGCPFDVQPSTRTSEALKAVSTEPSSNSPRCAPARTGYFRQHSGSVFLRSSYSSGVAVSVDPARTWNEAARVCFNDTLNNPGDAGSTRTSMPYYLGGSRAGWGTGAFLSGLCIVGLFTCTAGVLRVVHRVMMYLLRGPLLICSRARRQTLARSQSLPLLTVQARCGGHDPIFLPWVVKFLLCHCRVRALRCYLSQRGPGARAVAPGPPVSCPRRCGSLKGLRVCFLLWMVCTPSVQGVQIWQHGIIHGQPVFTTGTVQPAASASDLHPVRSPDCPIVEPAMQRQPQPVRTIGVFHAEASSQPTVLHADVRMQGSLLDTMICRALGLRRQEWHIRRVAAVLPSLPVEQYVLSPISLSWQMRSGSCRLAPGWRHHQSRRCLLLGLLWHLGLVCVVCTATPLACRICVSHSPGVVPLWCLACCSCRMGMLWPIERAPADYIGHDGGSLGLSDTYEGPVYQ